MDYGQQTSSQLQLVRRCVGRKNPNDSSPGGLVGFLSQESCVAQAGPKFTLEPLEALDS